MGVLFHIIRYSIGNLFLGVLLGSRDIVDVCLDSVMAP